LQEKKHIKKKYKIKEIGEEGFVIEIKFIKYKNGYFIHQRRYIKKILEKFK